MSNVDDCFNLVVAAIMAILMVAAAFEDDMNPVGLYGVLAFATIVVLVDGVGWNAKLIYSHYNPESVSNAFSNATKPPRMLL